MSYISRPGIQSNHFSISNSYSDNKQKYYGDETINGHIVITPPINIKNMPSVELPIKTNGVNLSDGIVNACLITDKNNKSYRNNGSCIGNTRSQYASVNYFTPVATLTQSLIDGTQIQPNNDNINISLTLDKFTLINTSTVENTNNIVELNVDKKVENTNNMVELNVDKTVENTNNMVELNVDKKVENTNNMVELNVDKTVENTNNMVELNVEKSAIDIATKNVITEEIVTNVQKNTEAIVQKDISHKVEEKEAFEISKTVGSNVASYVEIELSNNNLPNKTSSSNDIAELVKNCVFTKLKQLYNDENNAFESAIKITNQTMEDIDPAKYKLLIEIATNQLNVNKDVQKVASIIGQELVKSNVVENDGKNTIISNVDATEVVNNIKSIIDTNNEITNAIKNVKSALEPEIFMIHGPGNKVTMMAEGNNVIDKTNEKFIKQIVNKVVEQVSPEQFSQYPIKYTNLSSNIVVLDKQQNRINLNNLVTNIIEHLADAKEAKIVVALENQVNNNNQVTEAAVSVEKKEEKIVIVPQMEHCNCSNDQLKELCKKISLDTGAKKVEVTITPEEVKPIIITVEKPTVSVESTIKTTLDAVNEQVSKTSTYQNQDQNKYQDQNKNKYQDQNQIQSMSFVDVMIVAIILYLLYAFMMRKH